jgi:hypothetical protein
MVFDSLWTLPIWTHLLAEIYCSMLRMECEMIIGQSPKHDSSFCFRPPTWQRLVPLTSQAFGSSYL